MISRTNGTEISNRLYCLMGQHLTFTFVKKKLKTCLHHLVIRLDMACTAISLMDGTSMYSKRLSHNAPTTVVASRNAQFSSFLTTRPEGTAKSPSRLTSKFRASLISCLVATAFNEAQATLWQNQAAVQRPRSRHPNGVTRT